MLKHIVSNRTSGRADGQAGARTDGRADEQATWQADERTDRRADGGAGALAVRVQYAYGMLAMTCHAMHRRSRTPLKAASATSCGGHIPFHARRLSIWYSGIGQKLWHGFLAGMIMGALHHVVTF